MGIRKFFRCLLPLGLIVVSIVVVAFIADGYRRAAEVPAKATDSRARLP